jgi:hypothetical protein
MLRIEGLTAVRPPGVWAINSRMSTAADIDPTLFVHQGVKVGALFGQETGVLQIALPVFYVEFGVTNVEVAEHERKPTLVCDLLHALLHSFEKLVFLVLLRCADIARVHVGADHRDGLFANLEVCLEPAAGAVETLCTEFGATRSRFHFADYRNTGATLCRGIVVQDVPLVAAVLGFEFVEDTSLNNM